MRRFVHLMIWAFGWFTFGSVLGIMLVGCVAIPTYQAGVDDAGTNASQGEGDPDPGISSDEGGTVPIIQMPFENGHVSQCTQGANGATSHHSTSTLYDIDFDTSNTAKEELRAPVSGTAFVHTEDASKNFGYHVCIDLGNGMYVIVGHMADIAISNGEQISAGQYIGHEGCTGYCSGDHVHVGLHLGDASKMGQFGTSIPVRYMLADQTAHTSASAVTSSSLVCGIKALGDKVNGHFYVSTLISADTSRNSTSQRPDAGATSSNSAPDASSSSANTPDTSVVYGPQNPNKDLWLNDENLDGAQETLFLLASRWLDPKAFEQDAFVWGTGGCFDGSLTEADRVHAENGYYQIDFSKLKKPCIGDLTLISAVGTDGNPPNAAMTNWNWWQNFPVCSKGSSFCELQKNGTSWEEWLIRVSWDPYEGLMSFGNGYTKNSQLK